MNGDKEKRIIALAGDQEMMRLLNQATRNWEIAKNRVEQIAQEREEGINDDNGVEMMPVYVRMDRVYACMMSLVRRPQAFLLSSVVNRLSPFLNEKSMDAELTRLMSENDEGEPDFWTMLSESQTEGIDASSQIKKLFTEMLMKYVTPHLDSESIEEVVNATSNVDSQVKSAYEEGLKDYGLFTLSRKLNKTANDNSVLMAIGLLLRHTLVNMICQQLDIQNHEDAVVANLFELAKKQLMESDAWHEYWTNHKRLLELKGSLDEQWKLDAAETEQWLLNLHGYIYNKWNESPEAFGQALKRERLDDDTMLLLLYYLAKKDAIVLETEEPKVRRDKMQAKAFETAMKLQNLAAEKYFNDYAAIWQRIIMSENITQQLLNYNSSKYNQGFNMMCLCKIVGYLHREYHFYGSHTPEEMGKLLGDRYVKNSYDTFSSYIKKKETMLNGLCFNEIDEALKIAKKENSET
jgi:hypothetical protein